MSKRDLFEELKEGVEAMRQPEKLPGYALHDPPVQSGGLLYGTYSVTVAAVDQRQTLKNAIKMYGGYGAYGAGVTTLLFKILGVSEFSDKALYFYQYPDGMQGTASLDDFLDAVIAGTATYFRPTP